MIIKTVIVLIIITAVIVGFTRTFLHKEIDDVHPLIMDADDSYIKKSKWLWVIPLYMDDPISNYPLWVENLKQSGKMIGMHGVKHTHREFGKDLSEKYIDMGVKEFEKAFGYRPKYFKAPSLDMTKNNARKIRARDMMIKSRFNQIIHTVYHSPDHRQENGRLVGE